jgi:hypothetical protein
MPKALVKLEKSVNVDKLRVSLKLAGVKPSERFVVGETLHLEVLFKDPAQLVEMGRNLERVTGNEIPDPEKVAAEKAAKSGTTSKK